MNNIHRRLIRRLSIPFACRGASIEVAGHKFQTPKIYGSMCELDEPWMIDLVTGLLSLRDGPFLDVGVNLGQTLLCVRALDPTRPYVGVEPNPLCVAYVEALKKENGLQDCTVVSVGIGERAAIRRLELYHGDTTDSCASLVDNFRPDQDVTYIFRVPVFPYETVAAAAGLDDPAIVKVDVEGSEWEVIHSMLELIARAKPWFIVEILPCYSADNHERIERQNGIQSLMRENGYCTLRLIKRAAGRLESLLTLDDIGIHGDMNGVDYLFCPRGDVPAISSALSLRNVEF